MKLLFKTMMGVFVFVFILSSYFQNRFLEETKEKTLLLAGSVQKDIKYGIEKFNGITNKTLEGLLLDKVSQLDVNRTVYERQGLTFNYLNVLNIKKDYESNYDIGNHYESIKKVESMQKVAIYISKLHKVNLTLSEEIVYNTYLQGKKFNVEPLLVLSVIDVESTYRPEVMSSAGAIGLTQVMPNFHKEKIAKLDEGESLWSIGGNIQVGTHVLKEYIVLAKGDTARALQMYNGSTNDETLKYSNKVFGKFNNLKSLIKKDTLIS